LYHTLYIPNSSEADYINNHILNVLKYFFSLTSYDHFSETVTWGLNSDNFMVNRGLNSDNFMVNRRLNSDNSMVNKGLNSDNSMVNKGLKSW
jgi:hypothetical protein